MARGKKERDFVAGKLWATDPVSLKGRRGGIGFCSHDLSTRLFTLSMERSGPSVPDRL